MATITTIKDFAAFKRWANENSPALATDDGEIYCQRGLVDMDAMAMVLNILPALIEVVDIELHIQEVKAMTPETIARLQVSEGWQESTLQNAERDLLAALDALKGGAK